MIKEIYNKNNLLVTEFDSKKLLKLEGKYIDKEDKDFHGEKIDILLSQPTNYTVSYCQVPELSKARYNTRKRSVNGGAVIVPEYLNGNPKHFSRTERFNDVYTVYIEISFSNYVGQKDITKYTNKCLEYVNNLKKYKKVNLILGATSVHRRNLLTLNYINFGLSDYQYYYNVLSNVAFFRRVIFQQILDSHQFNSSVDPSGLGRPIHTEKQYKNKQKTIVLDALKIKNGIMFFPTDNNCDRVENVFINNDKIVKVEVENI
jgi:hypothetical protein